MKTTHIIGSDTKSQTNTVFNYDYSPLQKNK